VTSRMVEPQGAFATVIAAAGVVLNNRKLRVCFWLWIVSSTIAVAGTDTAGAAGRHPRGGRVRHRHLPAAGQSGTHTRRTAPAARDCPEHGRDAARGETSMRSDFSSLLRRHAGAGLGFLVWRGAWEVPESECSYVLS
jgi:hypothetical protein